MGWRQKGYVLHEILGNLVTIIEVELYTMISLHVFVMIRVTEIFVIV